MPRTRRPAAWWHAHADDLRALTNAGFAARHGVHPSTTGGWRHKLRIPSPGKVPP